MILIIDNGSQYTHLIKRNCRDLGYEADILNASRGIKEFEKKIEKTEEQIKIILSGGPGSVYSDPPNLSSYTCRRARDDKLKLPLLGICYGHQMIGHIFGAKVTKGKRAEYGTCKIKVDKETKLFFGVPKRFRAWVSHFDEVKDAPKDFEILAHSEACSVEAMCHKTKTIFGVQFHPEVWHTEHGEHIIKNFLEL